MRNIVSDSYATPGFADQFLGTKDNPSTSGSLIMEALRGSFQGVYYDLLDYFIKVLSILCEHKWRPE